MRNKGDIKKETVAAKITEKTKEKINQIVKESKYLELTKSEVVSEILEMYFDAKHAHGEKIRERVIKRRKRGQW